MTKKQVKRKPRKVVTKAISIVVILVAIYMFLGVGGQVYHTLQLQRDAEEAAKQLQILQDENASLLQRRNKLEDPNYVETYARGEYMFSKDDEKVFYLPKNPDTSATGE